MYINEKFNYCSNAFFFVIPSFRTTSQMLKIASIGIACLATLASFFYILYLKMGNKRKIGSLTTPSFFSLFKKTLDPISENAHQLKKPSLKAIEGFLKEQQQEKFVYFENFSTPISTALLRLLIKKKIFLNEKELVSFYSLKNFKGETWELTGFEKALLMQYSVPLYNFWKVKNGEKISLIQDNFDFDLLKTLLKSLYDPKILKEKQTEICLLAELSFKFHLNEEEINSCLENLFLSSFEQNDLHNIETFLKFFKFYQKPLTPAIQQALQNWLNSSIGTPDFLSHIQILKHYSPYTFDLSDTSISDKELSYLSVLSLSTLILKNCKITDQGLEHLKGLSQLQVLNLNWSSEITDRGLEHLKGLSQLQILNLNCCSKITDQGLEHLKGLPDLQKLNLSNSGKITDRGLEHLKGLSQLKKLNLNNSSKITDRGLEYLKGLSQLQNLDLSGCDITDQGLEHLKSLHQLEKLNLYFCKSITDQGLRHLKGLPYLQKLDLSSCDITDQGLEHLKGSPELQNLDLSDCDITDQGLQHLQGLPQLKNLNLSNCSRITSKGLEHLKDLTQLQELNLSHSIAITSKGLEHLKDLTQLKKLDLSDCNEITDQGLEHLKNLFLLQKLDLSDCNISDRGLKHLKGLPHLQNLDLSGCGITDQGLEHLKDLQYLQDLDLTDCDISDQGLELLKGLQQLQDLSLLRCKKITDQGLEHLKGLYHLEYLNLEGCQQISSLGRAFFEKKRVIIDY